MAPWEPLAPEGGQRGRWHLPADCLVTMATATASVYVRRRLAALGLEGLLLAVRTLSVTRLRFRLSDPSLDPKSELLLSLSLLDFSADFPKLPEDEKTGRQNHLAENRISKILFHLPARLKKTIATHTTLTPPRLLLRCGHPCGLRRVRRPKDVLPRAHTRARPAGNEVRLRGLGRAGLSLDGWAALASSLRALCSRVHLTVQGPGRPVPGAWGGRTPALPSSAPL